MARKKKRKSKKRKSSKKTKKKSTTAAKWPKGGTAVVEPPPVAEVAEQVAVDSETGPAEDEPVAVDLDADLDDEVGVDRLIAETLASAGVEKVPTTEAPVEAPAAEPSTVPAADGQETVAGAEPDLGPISSPELRDRLLAEALAHAEHKDARYRVPFSGITSVVGWKLLAASLILLVAGAVAALPPAWATPEAPAAMDASERARSLRSALLLEAQQVEAFRVRNQRLPASLDEVPVRLPGIRYVRSGARAYQLVTHDVDGSAVIFDSASPTPAFRSIQTEWALQASQP